MYWQSQCGLGSAEGVGNAEGDLDERRLDLSVPGGSGKAPDIGREEFSRFHRAVARLNYLALGRAGTAAAVSLLAFSTARPKSGDVVRLKRMLRYLRSHAECLPQTLPKHVIYSPTVVGQAMWANLGQRVGTWFVLVPISSQSAVASRKCVCLFPESGLSVDELNAQVLGLGGGLGNVSLCEFWGLPCVVPRLRDDSAATGTAGRAGVGKLRHSIVEK